MSFTLVKRPTGYQPIYNDLEVLCTSTSASQPKFQFCMDVTLIDDSVPYTASIGRFKARPITSEAQLSPYGFFNLSDILQSRKEFQTWPINPFQKQAYSISVQMGFESAASTSAAPVYVPTSAFSFVGYNGALPVSEYQNYNSLNLYNDVTTSGTSGIGMRFLTSLPNRKIVNSTELNLDVLNNSRASRYLVKFFNGATLLNTTSGSATSTFFETYKRLDFSPSQFTIPSGTTRYAVELIRQGNTNPLTQPYEVLLNSECTRFEAVNVYFQNKYGAEDVYVFNRKSTKQSNIDRKNFKRGFGLNTPYSIQGTNTFASNIKRQHTLNSDWLTQAESEALSELVESNNVFIAFDGNYIPGRKSQVDFTFTLVPDIGGDFYVNAGWFFSVTNANGTYTYTQAVDTDLFPDAAAVADELIPLIRASVIGAFYDVVDISGASLAFRLIAKQTGTALSITGTSTSTSIQSLAYGTFGTVTTGLNADIPQRIPVTVNNDSFEYRKKTNGDLIQIELTVTEKASYERQAK